MADEPKLEFHSPHRVALDLAYTISHVETQAKKDRNYWLKLYHEVRRVVVVGAAPKGADDE